MGLHLELALALTAAAAWPGAGLFSQDRLAQARLVVASWPAPAALAARVLLEKYGPPDEIADAQLSWSRNGPWRRTVAHRSAAFPLSSLDLVEQSVDYEAPQAEWPALAGFGHGLSYDAARRTLTARSPGEATNFLALNLADDIVQGRLGPQEADLLYSRTLAEAAAGRTSPYLQGLAFQPDRR